ncbi:MAG: sigma-70 family RNA polymerase sigma factor [Planctomycetota bacterium]
MTNEPSSADDRNLPELEKLQGGDSNVAEVFSSYRDRLLKMIRYRLDTRLVGRVDPEDLLQEVWIDVQRRISEYNAKPNVPFLLWLRQLTTQVLAGTHRRHLGTKKRDASLERSMRPAGNKFTGSISIARNFVDSMETPSKVIAKEELIEILIKALDGMEEIDREIIMLRHLEELSNREAALELGIEAFAASKRYLRAMKRLTTAMGPVLNPDQTRELS